MTTTAVQEDTTPTSEPIRSKISSSWIESAEEDDIKSAVQDELGHQREEEATEERERWHRHRKIGIGVCLLALIIFVIIDSTTTGYVKSGIESLLVWVEENPRAGAFAFTLVVFVATVMFIPAAILTIGAGFVFERACGLGLGILVGTVTVFLGASSGAVVSFLIGRYLLRDCVKGLAKKYATFEALDVAMKEKGFHIMVMLRLSPIIPFNVINYVSGVTAMSFASFTLANVAILPGTVLFVFVGASASCISNSMSNDSGKVITVAAFVAGAAMAILAVCLTSYYAKRELNRIVAERDSERDLEEGGGEEESQSPESTDDSSLHT